MGKYRRWGRGSWGRAILGVGLVLGCRAPEDERISCDDLLPAEQATFEALLELVQTSRRSGSRKGCTSDDCHGAEQAQAGYRFDERAAVYDAFTTRIDPVYGQVATGAMPPADSGRWDEADLRLLRTWYCNGGFVQ